MKKSTLLVLGLLACASCQADNDYYAQQSLSGTTATAMPASVQISGISPDAADFYRKNIVVKAMGDDFVVYEYSNVQVDKVATLAAGYCEQTNPGKKAYLRDIYMHKNHKRRATFDCVDLATM